MRLYGPSTLKGSRKWGLGKENTMATRCLFLGWNHPIVGREKVAVECFNSCLAYLGKQAGQKNIESFEPCFMNPHGGDLNGFILVRGDSNKLHTMVEHDEWRELVMRCEMNVDGFGIIWGTIGGDIATEMTRYQKLIP